MDLKINFTDEIIKLLEYLFSKMGIAIDWSSDNILPYIMELMNKIVQYTLWKSVILLVLIIIFSAIVMRIYVKYVVWENIVDYNDRLFDALCRCILIGVTCMCIYAQAETIVACIAFPEKVVIEYIQEVSNKIERR